MPVAESWEEGRTHSMKRGRKKLCLPQGGMGPRLGGISFILQIQDQDSERQGSLTIVGWLALPNQSNWSHHEPNFAVFHCGEPIFCLGDGSDTKSKVKYIKPQEREELLLLKRIADSQGPNPEHLGQRAKESVFLKSSHSVSK